ncbi:MAG TPA: hypothetical protein VGD43_16045 [Micromonospora sp.]
MTHMLTDLDEPRTRSGPPAPVFVDRTGRRRRLSVFAGVGIAVGLLASLALILAGLFSGSSVPVPGWPDAQVEHSQEPGGGQPEPSPTPSEPTPSDTGPETAPTATTSQRATEGTNDPGTDPSPPGEGRRNGHGPSKTPGKPR